MRDLNRICKTMDRCTRGLFAADVLLSVALVGLIVASSFWPTGPGASSEEGDVKTQKGQDAAPITKSDIDKAITGKALFRTSASILKDKVVNELAQFELKGISVRKGKKTAHIRDTKLKKLLTKKVGETLGNYEILDIGTNGITLKRGSETLVLSKG